MKFYDVKNKRHVNVPSGDIMKKKTTKNGRTTHFFVGELSDGREVYKIVSKDDYARASYPMY
tara:strand:- start:1735 stop:1920 length:186 start_codon:yes stop_codon:yes gene_type:complete